MSSQVGHNQNLTRSILSTSAGEGNDVRTLIGNTIKGLSYLIEHIEYLEANEYWGEEIQHILNLAEELENKQLTIVERMENSQSGEMSEDEQ